MKKNDDATLAKLFHEARSHNGWLAKSVSDAELQAAYDIAKWGPTSMNTQPMRLVIIRFEEDKKRLLPALSPGNVEKVMTAPVVALICHDTEFHRQLSRTFPHRPEVSKMFEANQQLSDATAFRNGSLQAAYFLLALRAVGLDVGPMSGFDPQKVNDEFLRGSSWRINLIVAIGHGDPSKIFPRSPRLEFEEVASSPNPIGA